MLVRLSPGAKSKVKSSVQRAIRNKALETYPLLAPYIDEIMPKKSQLDLIKLYVPEKFHALRSRSDAEIKSKLGNVSQNICAMDA